MGTLTFALLYKGVQRTIEQRTIEILCMIFLCTFQSHIGAICIKCGKDIWSKTQLLREAV